MINTDLTERQKNEIEYHKQHAQLVAEARPRISYEIIESSRRRLHNAYWHLYTLLLREPLAGKRVLIVGCGSGPDALRIAKMGASVYAFDLSPDMLALARASANEEGVDIEFSQMPAERLEYDDDFFDYIVAIDILHHVDVDDAMREVVRVAKDGCKIYVDEIYSHSWTDRIRHSRLVEKYLYPAMVKWIYRNQKPYITEDERKLSEDDINLIERHLSSISYRRYFNFIVNRLIPDKFEPVGKIDYLTLRLLGGLGQYLAGRTLFVGLIGKP